MYIYIKSNQTLLRAKCSQKAMQKSKAYNHIQTIQILYLLLILYLFVIRYKNSFVNKLLSVDCTHVYKVKILQ